MFERKLQVQGRDGAVHELIVPEAALPRSSAGNSSSPPVILRITVPSPLKEMDCSSSSSSVAPSFFRQSRDASNLVVRFLDPDSLLELEGVASPCRTAVRASRFWSNMSVLDGHSHRFRGAGERKRVYVRHRRALCRVARGFEDLRRFARSPSSVFNPGASLADTFHAEKRTGVVLPDEARASFILFDGQARSTWLRSEGVIGGFELLSLDASVELMLEEAWFRMASGSLPEFVPLADRRNGNEWLAAAVDNGRVVVIKPLSRPKVVASSWSQYLRVQ